MPDRAVLVEGHDGAGVVLHGRLGGPRGVDVGAHRRRGGGGVPAAPEVAAAAAATGPPTIRTTAAAVEVYVLRCMADLLGPARRLRLLGG
ncbi:hypothetical protein GCM10020254_30090 [Streptomyces goshikiensis]